MPTKPLKQKVVAEKPAKVEISMPPGLVLGPYDHKTIVDYAANKAVFNERIPELQRIEGIYTTTGEEPTVGFQELPSAIRKDLSIQQVFSAWDYLKAAKARTPKFTKWLASVKPDAKQVHDAVAKLLQDKFSENVVISCHPNAIYNSGNSPAFYSCLTMPNGPFASVLNYVMKTATGVAVAYIAHKKGYMSGRVYLQAMEHKDTKEKGILVCNSYGCLSTDRVVGLLKREFPDLYLLIRAFDRKVDKDWQFVNGLPPDYHWDNPPNAQYTVVYSPKK